MGIVTFHFVPNYGAVWQALALQEALQKLGHEVVVIDYRPKHVFDGGGFWLPCSPWRLKANVVIAYQHFNKLRRRFSGGSSLDGLFEHFIQKHLQLGESCYRSEAALRKNPPPLDAVVCGSDQIWNPSRQRGTDPMYFLDFAAPHQQRVAYAASFGRANIEQRHEKRVGELIRGIGLLSVRERSGVELCRKLSGRDDATVVPDPTLLRAEWPEAEGHPEAPARYLFSYVLRSAESIQQLTTDLALELGLKVLRPLTAHAQSVPDGVHSLLLSPTQWLAGIRDAEAVVTNSFHGTIFSILFRRPFLTVSIGTGKEALNERANSLLEQLGLQDRFYAGENVNARELMERPIDWVGVDARLASLRSEGLDFLHRALNPQTPTAAAV